MKTLTINLKQLARILETQPLKNYAVAIIDNFPPTHPWSPWVGNKFIWIEKTNSLPMKRKELEKLFSRYGIKVEKEWICIFHHHDLKEPYLKQGKKKIEYYEFSHVENSIAYIAMNLKDAKNIVSYTKQDFLQI